MIPNVSICVADEKVIILDVVRDRYFGLPPTLPVDEFVRAIDEPDRYDTLAMAARLGRSLDFADISLCAAVEPVFCDIDDPTPNWYSIRHGLAIGWRAARFRRLLRRQGLREALLALRRRAPAFERTSSLVNRGCGEIAAAVRIMGYVRSLHDQCLPIALGIADHMQRIGYRPNLVIGVTAKPFRAHCWVQADGMLVSDRKEAIRDYTPILIL